MFSDGSAIWREWRMTRLLRGSMWRSVLVIALIFGRGRGRFIWCRTVKKKIKKEVWMSEKQGEWCMIGAYGEGL